ncbi:MAG: choice-of-anchor L domain-containing protein [Planctomycetes bacterium]|nr:choice-of-anchor L domain-containing protein [Planctomycetota bacterium]
MPNRRPLRSHWKFFNSRKRRAERLDRRISRRSLLEPLEQRQLLAVGPQLAGIQLNDGDLLRDGSVRQISPSELVFSFNDGAAIDPDTLSGIRLTRSGGDGLFSTATATSDFNTAGQVVIDFTAANSGESGNDISISVIKNAVPSSPLVSVLGNNISVELNSTTGTTAAELVDAINNDLDASRLLVANIRRGSGSTNLATPAINYSPIVTGGANAASITHNLNLGTSVEVKLTANQAGPAGAGIEVAIARVDFGGVAPPRVTVTDRLVTVELNSNSASPTTLGEFVGAINGDAAASNLITATLEVGDPNFVIGNRVGALRLPLANISDIPIVAGFVGLGDSPRQVVMRFSEPLPDDLYHVEIIGSGPFALRNVNGGAFRDATDDLVDDGADFGLSFELDLGAQILSVVPQPVLVNSISNVRSQFRDRINVYFNDDDLHPTETFTGLEATDPTVVDPAFYQLIFTNDTVQNTDDVVYFPTLVQYNPASDLAVLVFDEPIDQLGSGPGTFRLRIGTDEVLPLPPLSSAAGFATTSTDFGTQGAESITITASQDFATRVSVEFTKRDFGAAGTPVVSVVGQEISVELNTNAGNESTAQQVVSAINSNAQASQLVTASLAIGTGTTDIATTALATTLTLTGVGSSFETASKLGTLAGQSQSLVVSAAIDPQAFALDFPGDEDEPGHRDLRPELQRHFLTDFNADNLDGITTAFYNFENQIGFDPQGNAILNAITEAQKERTREIYSLYSAEIGINFIETANLGMTVATGDLRAIDSTVKNGPGGTIGLACPNPPIPDGLGTYACFVGNNGLLDGLAIMDLQDFSDPGADAFGGSWFLTAMHEIGHMLGLGHTDELPELTILNGGGSANPLAFPENTVEPIFPGDHDIVHGQNLYRPDSKDIDLFQFQLPENGRLSIETFAERLQDTSRLDTVASLFRQTADGSRELIARNDDYYSNDSYIELDLPAGTYWVGVSASGNDEYDPAIDDSGLGGTTDGPYDLRLNFRPDADRTIVDATGVRLDGDVDGVPGGVYDTWFRATEVSKNIFVDKSAPSAGNGTLGTPFQLISNALASAQSGDVVRILANGGADRNLATPEDNRAYEIGFNRLGAPLADGTTLEVPQGVTVVVDAGAVIKLRRARIGVGSSSVNVDRSAGALQILGTPVLLDAFNQVARDPLGEPIPGSVFLTSIHDSEIGFDTNPDSFPPDAVAGDWGGIVFRNDIDQQDANRFNYERQGIFLNVVSNAALSYGGGTVLINGASQVVTPIHITDSRPTIAFNDISFSADAAMSASPNSFEETNFESPPFQFTPFTSDYDRVGPNLFGNTAIGNSINGLFVRVTTPAGNALQPLTVPARLDDTDLPYVLADQLVIQGTPGGHELEIDTPTVQLVTSTPVAGGSLAAGTYNYRVVFVDADGNEGAPSSPTGSATIDANSNLQSIRLDNLPVATAGFISRRIYRSQPTGNANGAFVLVGEININSTSFTDTGGSLGRQLTGSSFGTLRARLDARLAIDPGVVVKLNGGGIESTLGGDFYAEGVDGREIVFTSIYDDRYGGGGSFDTTSDLDQVVAAPGDWGGLTGGHLTNFSLDNVLVAFGGGIIDIEGSFAGFNPIELQQSTARITHSTFEDNGSGTGGQAGFDRAGRGFNRPGTIFVRGAQPTIVDNDIFGSLGPAINIDVNSLNREAVRDRGRSSFNANADSLIELVDVALDNQGPLVRLNRLSNNSTNGMQVRGGTLTTEGVWDDTDIVHVVVNESINVSEFHTFGGLRLESSATESLVVKLSGSNADFTATGLPLDIDDRIGGALQIIGQPGHPVVLTSLADDTVGAGFQPDGLPQLDTNNDGIADLSAVTPTAADILTVTSTSIDGNALRDALLGPGVTAIGNATLIGGPTSAGFFSGGSTGIGIESGIILSNGNAPFASGPNISDFSTGIASLQPDADLDAAFNVATTDTTYLQFDFSSDSSELFFNYVFASEEYNEFANSAFNDVFGFFLDGQNIALLPGTTTQVSINTVNGGGPIFGLNPQNPQFYVNNDPSNAGLFLNEVGYDGFTVRLTAQVTNLAPGPHTIKLAVSDVVDTALDSGIFLETGSFSNEVISRGGPGDWGSIALEQYSHDRNVESIVEAEPAESAAPGVNGTPQLAQVLGLLAPNEKAGDENLRLGFELQGSLTAPDDIDVYSFSGQPGTEVWLDIDATRNSLDTVVELVDASGTVLARSDNSLDEAIDPGLLVKSASMGATGVNPLRKSSYDPLNPTVPSALEIPDRYSTNPRDAGMRVVLPGQPGVSNIYHVRVRSSSDNLADITAGKTFGNYQLQVRLRELDEVPGSTVRYSDIRFATTGVELFGLPAHSPITGEAGEIETFDQFTGTFTNPNDSLGTAQDVGNVAQSDRGVIGVSGELSEEDDVDFYRLIVEYDRVQPSPPNDHLAAIFDIDYADGLGRPSTVLSVFDSDGVLILRSKGSNVADDRSPPLSGSGITELSAGSVGTDDPYIGPVELPAGPELVPDGLNDASDREVYYVAVSSNTQLPTELQQYLDPNPANPLIRMEPVNSIRRIAEDRISFGFGQTVAEPPEITVLLDPTTSVVPFTLGDVTLFVSQDIGLVANTTSTLHYVDPFTGDVEATAGSFPEPIADIAIRGDGNLFAFATGPDNNRGLFNDGTIGSYTQINTGDATTTNFSDDSITTNVQTVTLALGVERAPLGNNNAGVGIEWDAITYQSDVDVQFGNGFVVGSTGDARDNDPDQVGLAGTDYLENVLFHFDTRNGVVANQAPSSPNRMGTALLNGVGTDKREYGEILTFTRIVPLSADIGDTFVLTIAGESISYTVVGVPIDLGNPFGVVLQGRDQEVVAGLANAWQAKALTSPAFAAFEVLNSGQLNSFIQNSVFGLATELRVRLVDPAFADVEIEWSVIEGSVSPNFIGFNSFATPTVFIEGNGPGGRVTGIDFVGNDMYAVTDRGGLYQVDLFGGFGTFIFTGTSFFSSNNLATYVSSSAIDLMTGDNGQPIEFSGLTAGPENVANGQYADTLFGITDGGELYAFNTRGELQPIFVNDQTSVDTGLFAVNGLAFSNLDRNLWEVTGNRGNNPGHGLNGGPNADYETFDHSQQDLPTGGSSFFFGNDRDSNVGGNQRFLGGPFTRDYNFAGGAHGTVITNPFSLEGYAPADLPVLYFNYFLDTEGTDYDPAPNPDILTRDSFRVFVSDDDGEWTLLATNNVFQDAVLTDEFDFGEGYDPSVFDFDALCQYPSADGEPCVQPLFDNTGGWRQARISLGRFAGSENLRLRFDFSTAGEMDLGPAGIDTVGSVGSELRAVSGAILRDGQNFTLDFSNRLEFDFGYTLDAPNGSQIQDGDSFTISPSSGRTITFEFDNDSGFAHDIAVQNGIDYRDGQTFTVTSGNVTETFEFDSGASLLVPLAGANALSDGQTFEVNGVTFEFDDDGVFAGGNNIVELIVDQGIRIPAVGGGTGGLSDGELFTINDGAGGADISFEFDDDGLVNPGSRAVDTTNIELQVPIAGFGFGGIQDGDTFSVDNGSGNQPTVFEFDKDNSVGIGNRVISVTDSSSQSAVVGAIINALNIANLGLNPASQGGGVIRMGVFRHTVDTSDTATLSDRTIAATANEIADRMVDLILNSGLRLTPTNLGNGPIQPNPDNGLIQLGSTVHVVTTTSAPSLTVQLVRGNQDEISDLMIAAIVNAAVNITPVNLGGGEVFLGATTSVDVTGAPALNISGTPGLNDASANAVVFTPTQSSDVIANSITVAINTVFGINAVTNGSVVALPPGVSFSAGGSAVNPADVISVTFDADTNPEGIARNIEDAIQGAFTPAVSTVDLTIESNDRFATATDTGITGGPTLFRSSGVIGDNPAFPFKAGLDVDFVRMDLATGDEVSITAVSSTFTLQPAIQLFDQQGRLIRTSSAGFNFLTGSATQANIDFTAVTPGTYFVGVSSTGNLDYNPDFAGSADVTLRIPFQGSAIGGLTDGESISISQGLGGTPVVFEFDRNNVVAANAISISLDDIVLQVPAAGVGPGGIQDGDTFTINDNAGSGDVVFEFDTDGIVNTGATSIFVSQGLTPQTIASQIGFAISSNPSVGLSPTFTGTNTVELNTTIHSVDISGTPNLVQLTTPRTQAELLTLLRDAIRTAGLGLAPQLASTTFTFGTFTSTFFTGGLTLDITDQVVDASLAPNVTEVIPTATGGYDLSIDIVESFDVFRIDNRVNLPSAQTIVQSGLPSSFISGRPGVTAGRTAVNVNSGMSSTDVAQVTATAIGQSIAGYTDQIVAVSGADIADGEIFAISDGNTTVNFEFESGYSIQIPDPATDPNALLDGESFTISRPGSSIDFEFDNNGIVSPGNLGLRVNDLIIEIPAGGVTEDLDGDGRLDFFNEDVNFNGILDLGEDIDLDGNLDLGNEDRNFNFVLDGGIEDGDTFTIDRGPGTPTITFEYDTDAVTTFGNEVISVTPVSDETQVSNATVAVLNNAGLGLDARIIGVGGGGNPFSFFFGSSSLLIQLGITDHNVDMTLTPTVSTSTTPRTQDELAELIVDVVGGSGLGILPTYLGNGAIHLGGTASHNLDLSNVATITSTGLPGASDPNAIVIPVFPSSTVSAADVSQLILSAINTARVNRNLSVVAVADGARRVNLLGATVLTDFTQAPSIPVHRSGATVTSYQNIVNVVDHTVTNPGPLGLEEALAGDEFGAFEASGIPPANPYPGALRGLDNAREGVYVDDIIIGFAERGEVVIGATADATFVRNPELFNIELPVEFLPANDIREGSYELEIRRAEEFGRTVGDLGTEIFLQRSFDTNDRITDAVSFVAPAGHEIVEGLTFTLSDGSDTVTFEFDDLAINDGVALTTVRIPYNVRDTESVIARRIRDAINLPISQSILDITAAMADGVVTGAQASPTSPLSSSSVVNLFGNSPLLTFQATSGSRNVTAAEPNDVTISAIDTGIGTSGVSDFTGTGTIGDNANIALSSADVDLFGMELIAGQTITIDVDTQQGTGALSPILLVFDAQFQGFVSGIIGSSFQFTAFSTGVHYIGLSGAFNFNYSPFIEGSGAQFAGQFGSTFSTGDYVINISTDESSGFGVTEFTDTGDRNVVREQGQVLIHSNSITNSLNFGVASAAGARDGSGGTPHVGPPRTTREVNAVGLTTGVVIANNVIAGNGRGGISFTGDVNPIGLQTAATPFGRIVNNTIVGDGSGTGILVADNASPTLLNNIVADLDIGISVDPTSVSTIIGGTLYRGNATNASGTSLGASAIQLTDPLDPLFVDESTGNYYLAPGARAIDSSIDSLQDRPEIVAVRAPLGYPTSPILAPDMDALGQRRVDDPSVSSGSGQGSNVFKDRGALDRADFAGPTATLISPRDNDALGFDSDGRTTFVNLTNQIVQNFSIQLLDGIEPNDPQDGTGASDASVRADRVTVFRDDEKLIEGVDYKFSYDATNNIIRLTPLAGIWEIDRKYDIELSNSRGLLITAPNGTEVVDGDSFGLTDDFGNAVNFEFDSGYVLEVPQTLALQVPATGGMTINDRDTITVTNAATSVTEIFEFDLDGFTTGSNIPISFTRFDSANTLANSIVDAIQLADTDLELSPVNVLNFNGRAVHLGTKSTHLVDLTNTSLLATGQLDGIDDGQTFSIDNGERRVIFEFSSSGGLTDGDRAIPFSFSETHEQIAESIVSAITLEGLDLNPSYVALSSGLINVGGEFKHLIDVTNSTLISTGTPGATLEFGIRVPTVAGELDLETIMDSEEFTISDGTDFLTIELDNDGIVAPDDPDSHPRVVVTFNDSTTTGQLVNAIAIAIRNGGVGLSPSNAGNGVVRLGGTLLHTLDVTNSSFTQLGSPGIAASIAVPFKAGNSFTAGVPSRTPIFSADEMAQSIAGAVDVAGASNRLRDAIATVQGPDINIEGISNVTGLATFLRSDIVDIAGNPLKPNREDGTTRFTVAVGSGVDYGDAPAPYPTQLADDGARHEVVGDFFLGSGVDVDFDGQPTDLADGDNNDGSDDENGVVFNTVLTGGFGGTITVMASASGQLDAWIDFNQDGDWNDAGEQIFASQLLSAADTVLTVNVPGNALPGDTFARFRLSGSGNLRPNGPAADGEVEDYQVSIVGNPWHNPENPLDVDRSNFVVPLDALIVINYINANGTGPLPALPGLDDHRVDTNGDGSATPIDVLRIVNALNDPSFQPEGEASIDVLPIAQSDTSDDLAESFATDVVIDQRIEVYDQQETQPQVRQAIREAKFVSASNEVFGSVDAFAGAVDGQSDSSDRGRGDADELDDLTPDSSWESGVDDIFGDWV